jgi:two-component system, NarL family, sensor kinase
LQLGAGRETMGRMVDSVVVVRPVSRWRRSRALFRLRRVSGGAAAVAVWVVSVALAGGAVAFVLALKRSGEPVPEVFLGNVWTALVFPAAGMLLVRFPPFRLMGWVLGVGGLGSGLAAFGFAAAAWATARHGLDGWAGMGVWVGSWVWMAGPLAIVVVVLLLPDGGAIGWRREALVAVVAAMAVRALLSAFASSGPDPISGAKVAAPNPLVVAGLERLVWPMFVVTTVIVVGAQLAGTVRLTRRWRAGRGTGDATLGVFAASAWFVFLPWGGLPGVGSWLDALVGPAFVVAITLAVLRSAAADVDVLVGRTYLWASLTTCVVAVYLLVVTLLSAALQRAGGASVAIAASGVVALLVAPLRTRLQRSVDRTLYGARADPYASIAGLSQQLEGTVAAEGVLPVVVRTITDELQLPYAAFRLVGAEGEVETVETGAPSGDLVVLPVSYLGEHVGELVVSTQAPGVALRPAERRLLGDLARQAGAAAHGVVTVTALRRSRERTVAAREEERRWLRRELHDDIGATLTGVALGIDTVGNLVPATSDAALQLRKVRAVVSTAVADLRRVIDGLRPPALDELGLVAALRDRLTVLVEPGGPVVHIRAEPLPSMPPATEVAAFHIVVEAVHNAVRHASARTVLVILGITPGWMDVSVSDDGRGIDDASGAGHGMSAMRQRAEEIGGRYDLSTGPSGTIVLASLPTGQTA